LHLAAFEAALLIKPPALRGVSDFQALYAAEQNRLLSIHILRFLTDIVESPDELVPIITACQENAWENITKMNSDMPAAPQRKENNREWPS
jgi:hypothetical protein